LVPTQGTVLTFWQEGIRKATLCRSDDPII
jgi:hypothetical protein